MPISLLYHDVVLPGLADSTGFPGVGAARYKITPAEFREHLSAIGREVSRPPALAPDAAAGDWMLTFDDGGSSALSPIAELLEEAGWRGHFFVTTDFIDRPGFLTASEVRDLRRRGHVVGSHSCSHPGRMTMCSQEELRHEWQDSRDKLSKILEEPIVAGSVPSGFYCRAVGRAAAACGYKVLFNSQPTQAASVVDDCRLLGRYTIVRGTRPSQAAAMAAGRFFPRFRQTVSWDLKKVAKSVGGNWYEHVRHGILAASYHDRDAAH
jgi:peptidoglycan/xylan/chitin deacetylase (PgdA/CDA1 family)